MKRVNLLECLNQFEKIDFAPNPKAFFVRDTETWFARYIKENKIDIESLNKPDQQMKCALHFYFFCESRSDSVSLTPILSEETIADDTHINAYLTVIMKQFKYITNHNYINFLGMLSDECKKHKTAKDSNRNGRWIDSEDSWI